MKISAFTAGFNCHNKIRRAQLTPEEIEKEMEAIAKSGLQEILILTGESKNEVNGGVYRRGM